MTLILLFVRVIDFECKTKYSLASTMGWDISCTRAKKASQKISVVESSKEFTFTILYRLCSGFFSVSINLRGNEI